MLRLLNPSYIRQHIRDLHHRLDAAERRLNEAEAIIDLVLTDAKFHPSPTAGLNGQTKRKQVVLELADRFNFEQVLETGTYFGMTTGFFATEFRVPVLSCEANQRYFHVAKRMLSELPNVHLFHDDSRSFLRKISRQSEHVARLTLFYLDAHWDEDLPLAEELDIIAQSWTKYVVLIDDFQVPGDSGYGYDDYGQGNALTHDYLRNVLTQYSLALFFPRIPSTDETGKKRGYAVVAPPGMGASISQSKLLTEFTR